MGSKNDVKLTDRLIAGLKITGLQARRWTNEFFATFEGATYAGMDFESWNSIRQSQVQQMDKHIGDLCSRIADCYSAVNNKKKEIIYRGKADLHYRMGD